MSNFAKIDLGTLNDVRQLFSYPNNAHAIGSLKQTLEETIVRYLDSSLKRDGYTDSSANVSVQNDRVSVEIHGSGAAPYEQLLAPFLSIGKLGFAACTQLLAIENKKRFLYNWRFFLPLGLAMTRHYSVQLLHFPPDYVLERDQDYLLAATTRRWAALLIENGADPNDTALYQNIIDIAPIAAPSGDGGNLNGIYHLFSDYINGLLSLWVPMSGGGVRPVVAFGYAVREWLKEEHKVDLCVLGLATITLPTGVTVPVLAANHPSFIYPATDDIVNDPTTPQDEQFEYLKKIMKEDLIAADWQVRMSKTPTADPALTLTACRAKWENADKQGRLCELTYEQALDKSPEQAKELCATLRRARTEAGDFSTQVSVSDIAQKLEMLRQKIGPTENMIPEKFANQLLYTQ